MKAKLTKQGITVCSVYSVTKIRDIEVPRLDPVTFHQCGSVTNTELAIVCEKILDVEKTSGYILEAENGQRWTVEVVHIDELIKGEFPGPRKLILLKHEKFIPAYLEHKLG